MKVLDVISPHQGFFDAIHKSKRIFLIPITQLKWYACILQPSFGFSYFLWVILASMEKGEIMEWDPLMDTFTKRRKYKKVNTYRLQKKKKIQPMSLRNSMIFIGVLLFLYPCHWIQNHSELRLWLLEQLTTKKLNCLFRLIRLFLLKLFAPFRLHWYFHFYIIYLLLSLQPQWYCLLQVKTHAFVDKSQRATQSTQIHW